MELKKRSLRTLGSLIGIGFLWTLIGCGKDNGVHDIRDYYFPLKKLEDGLVYEYRAAQSDSLTPIYWYYRSIFQDDNVYLTGTYYEYDLLPLQFVKEEVVRNGMLLEDIYLYSSDSLGNQEQIPVDILSGSTFPFEVRDSGGVFLYKIKWHPKEAPNTTLTLIKNRRYRGDTTFQYQGKILDCILFEVRELFEHEAEGFFEQEYSGLEIYAKGIGLVYFKKDIAAGMTIAYQLESRYPMSDLEEQFRERIEMNH